MKKSTISKIMLVLVMLALVFALYACGNNSGGGGSGGGENKGGTKVTQLTTPDVTVSDKGVATWKKVTGAASFECKITDADGKETTKTLPSEERSLQLEEGDSIVIRAVPDSESKTASEWSAPKAFAMSATKQLINLIKGVEGVTSTIDTVTKDDTLSAEVSISGYFAGESRNEIALSVKAKARKSNPEFMIDFKLNNKAYVTLGYKDNFIYLREPLNFVNNSATDKEPESFKMNVAALNPAVNEIMTWVMGKLGAAKLDISKMTTDVSEILDGVGAGIGGLLKIEDGPNNTKVIGITVDILGTALRLVPTVMTNIDVKAEVNKYIGYVNKALEATGVGAIKINDRELSYETIQSTVAAAASKIQAQKDAIDEDESLTESAKTAAKAALRESLLKITVGYNSSKVLNSLDLSIDLGALQIEGLDYQAGLNVGLPTFEIGDKITIAAPDFAARDLEIDLNARLAQKKLGADVKGVIRLSDAFAAKNNKWATVTVKGTGSKTDPAVEKTATGYIDANGAYVDFTGIFELLGVNTETYTAKYKAEYNENGVKFNLVDKINSTAALLNASAAQNGPDGATVDEDEEVEEDFDLIAMISDIASQFGAAENKADFVCQMLFPFVMMFDEAAVDFIGDDGEITQATVIKYAFERELGETGTSVQDYVLFYKNAKTFEALLDNIKECHEAGKTALDAATKTGEKKAGVQLYNAAAADDDLLDYISYFVKIPTIVDGEPSFEDESLKSPNDITALKGWLNWIFPTTNDYRKMVEDILGKTLDKVIDDGLYLEAIGGEGYHGAVRAAASDAEDAAEYVYLGAGFGLERSAADNMNAIEANVNFNDKVDGEFVIAKAAKAMLDQLRAY